MGKKYLGIGPSAHSFDGESRQWNIANNTLYIRSLQRGALNFEQEQLTLNDHFNEYVMTALRTRWGIDTARVKAQFGDEKFNMLQKNALQFIAGDLLSQKNNLITLTRKGMLVADRIICDLFVEE
jgi:oxygen-independent coproporphyrinogen-3 oxidase